MKINLEYIFNKVQQRKDKINTYATSKNIPMFSAAIFIDQNAPYTTNRKMLAEAGYTIDEVTEDNHLEVIHALSLINVNVLTNNQSVDKILRCLNTAIDEQVTECWGGPDMAEYIDITDECVFQSN